MKRNQLAEEIAMIQRRPSCKTSEEFYDWAIHDEEEIIQAFVHAFNLYEIFENRLFAEIEKACLSAGWSFKHIMHMKETASKRNDWGNNRIVAEKLCHIGQSAAPINLSRAK